MMADFLKLGARVKRNDTGAVVDIVEVLPNGLEALYRCEDVRDGHTVICRGRELRPVTAHDLEAMRRATR